MTDLLDRSMDLLHEKNEDNVHVLSFDSTYPTRIKGNLIKIFKATADYVYGESFSLIMDEETTIDIPKDAVASFGSKLKDADYFHENDCVLCSIEVLENGKGKIKLWNISREYNAKSEAMIFEYECNGVDDTTILSEIINILQETEDDGKKVSISDKGIEISSEARKTTRQIIFKIIGKLGLDHENVWHNFDQEDLSMDRERRLEYFHINSNKIRWESTDEKFNSLYKEDVFSYIFDFEECIILDDAKPAIERLNDMKFLQGGLSSINSTAPFNLSGRAFLFGLSGNAHCYFTIKNLRFCKDYMGVVFVDGNDKTVTLDNTTMVTNTYGGKIAPYIYGCVQYVWAGTNYNLIAEKDRYYIIADDCIFKTEDIDQRDTMYNYDALAAQDYNEKILFPILIDNFSTTSKVILKNSAINPNNEGYSVMPHIIHNSGYMSIDNTTINFYNLVRYYDDNTQDTMSAAIFNEPRVVDHNRLEYKQFKVNKNDIDKYKNRSLGLRVSRHTYDDINSNPKYEFDSISEFSKVLVPITSSTPTLEINNSNITHTKGTIIFNLHGIVKIYNSRLELITKKVITNYFFRETFDQVQKPFIASSIHNRIVDSYGGEVYVKDNTIITNGNSIQAFHMSPCNYNHVVTMGKLQAINNSFEAKYFFSQKDHTNWGINYVLEYLTPSIFFKIMAFDSIRKNNYNGELEEIENRFAIVNYGHNIILQNNTFDYQYTGDVWSTSYDVDYNGEGYSDDFKCGLNNINMDVQNLAMDMWKNGDFERTGFIINKGHEFGTYLLYNKGANIISIYNCNTNVVKDDVYNSPIFGIYDISADNAGKITIENSIIGSWCYCIASFIERSCINYNSEDAKYESESYPVDKWAHDISINNSKFINYFNYYDNKPEEIKRQFLMPIAVLEGNEDIYINNSTFENNDVIINTNNTTQVTINNSSFKHSKLLFNVFAYRFFKYMQNPWGTGSSWYPNPRFLSGYNIVCTKPLIRHSRLSNDTIKINNCSFNETTNTLTFFEMENIDVGDRVGKDCINRCNIIINSVKNVNISDSTFKSNGNNILMYGQQSALLEFYKPYQDALFFEKDDIEYATPFFNFNINLKNNDFTSIISEVDSYNKLCDELERDEHYIASNVLLYGDNVDITADSNTFKMASVDGGANILSLTDTMYYRSFGKGVYKSIDLQKTLYSHPTGTTNSRGIIYPLDVSNTISKARFDSAHNNITLINNEFVSFVFGVTIKYGDGSIGGTIDNIHLILYWQIMYEDLDSDVYTEDEDHKVPREHAILEFAPHIYRAFSVGIDNCNTWVDISGNTFSKSRGSNDAKVIDGCRTFKQRVYDHEQVDPSTNKRILVFADKDSNDTYSGFGIYFNSTKHPQESMYHVSGNIESNKLGINILTEDGNTTSKENDGCIMLDMQGLIFRNKYKSPGKYPSIFHPEYWWYSSELYSTFGAAYNQTINYNNATVYYDFYCRNNTYESPTMYNRHSSLANYSFDNKSKTIYK